VSPIIAGMGKATNFKFCTHFHTIDYSKSALTISGKVAVGVARDSRNFSGHPYIGRIARFSLFLSYSDFSKTSILNFALRLSVVCVDSPLCRDHDNRQRTSRIHDLIIASGYQKSDTILKWHFMQNVFTYGLIVELRT